MANNLKSAKQMMEQMYLERDEMGDVTFLVESERIRAHRIVLATQSPKYKAQFYGPNQDEGEICVSGVSAATFNVFLQFFYKETIDLTMDNIETVLDLAHQSLVDEFIECCVNFLKNAIKVNSNWTTGYRLAILYDIKSLRLNCEQRISTNTVSFLRSDVFRQCNRGLLLRILRIDTLDCKETDMFAACIAWARAYCRRHVLDDEKPENLRTALGNAIYQIRFSSFSADEFAELHKSMTGFFKPDESYELFYMTSKMKDFKSEKFNSTPRTPKKPEPSTAWSLEVRRFIRKIRLPTKIELPRRSSFSLSSDNPIRLHGFAIGMHFFDDDLTFFSNDLSVQIRSPSGLLTTLQLKCKVYRSDAPFNETMVIFDKPIERIKFFTCFFTLPLKRLSYEFSLHSSARVENTEIALDGKWVTIVFLDNRST